MRRDVSVLVIVILLVLAGAVHPTGNETASEEKRWADAGFGKPEIDWIDSGRFYPDSNQSFTHRLDITLVMFRGTGWRKKVVFKRLQKVADIYGRCGLRLGRIKLVIADAPGGMIDFVRPGYRDVEIAQKVPSTAKPIFFYFRSIPELNAHAWVQTQQDDEIPQAIRNTAWFSLSVTLKLNIKLRHPGYVSEAHELGHILLDTLEHVPDGVENLMAGDYEYVNDRLNPQQCEKIKSHPLVIPLE